MNDLAKAIAILENAIQDAYNAYPGLNYTIFEDLLFDLKKEQEINELELLEYENERRQYEADMAFFERFGHLGSI